MPGIRTDQQAVTNGLTLPWSSGQGGGQVNKMIKRQMYGRAGVDLLRKPVILHPALPITKFAAEPNYVSARPSHLGNYVSADSMIRHYVSPKGAAIFRSPA